MTSEKAHHYTVEQVKALFLALPRREAIAVTFAACSMNLETTLRALESAVLVNSLDKLAAARKEVNISNPLIESYETFSDAIYIMAKLEQEKLISASVDKVLASSSAAGKDGGDLK